MISSNQSWSLIIEFGERLIAEKSIPVQSRIFRDYLQNVFNCQAYTVLFPAPEDGVNSPSWMSNEIPEFVKTWMDDVIETSKTIVINNQNSSNQKFSIKEDENPQSHALQAITTPVRFNDQTFGVCAIVREFGALFTKSDVDFLEFLSSYAAIVFYTSNKESAERYKSDLLNLAGYVSAQITQIENLDDLSARITRVIQKTFDYYYVAIFTVEAGNDFLSYRKSAGRTNAQNDDNLVEIMHSENLISSPQLEVRMGQGIIGNVAQNGKEIIANDVSASQYYRYEDVLPETRSEAALPIKIGEKILGVLDIQSNETNTFQEADLIVLRGLSANIAVAIENSRLYIDLQKRHKQLNSIYEVSNAITSILKFDDLLDQVISLIHENLGYSSVHFYTFNPTNDDIIYQRGNVDNHTLTSSDDLHLSLDNEHSPVSWVARNKTHLIIGDFTESPELVPSTPLGKKACSGLLVPLLFAGSLLGILEIQSDLPNNFGKDDLYIVEALADNIAIALRNSNLYRSEQWRRQVADSLREVAGLLSADISLDQVLSSILEELINTLPSVIAVIWLLDEDYEDTEALQELRLSAVKRSEIYVSENNEQNLNLDLLQGLTIDEIIDTYGLDRSVKSWLLDIAHSKVPSIRDKYTPFEPVGALLHLHEDYSAISAPLRISEKPIGVLTLIHDQFGRYGENSELLSTTFANYAAVAIENTRLYESAHDQAWISTVLLQVTQAMQSIDSLDELLQTIVQILPDLIGANLCAVLLWDVYTDSFFPGVAFGFSPQQLSEFENWYIADSEVRAFDQIRSTKAPALIDQAGIPENIAETIFKSFNFSDGLYMLFPMITQNEVIGAVFVDLRHEEDQVSGEISLWEEKISIIQGVANQTAIAIENIQLIQSQEEEAYISVALLQVAQAVVTSNTLDEVLSAIVRITPILVGVTRSVIYLWDEAHGIFRTSQTYGFSRDELAEMQPFYLPDEFALLKYVQRNNKLIYFPVINTTVPFEWANLSYQDLAIFENNLEEVEIESKKEEIFQSRYPLLIGFPLAVKDNVLGVMLIEEAEHRSNIPSVHVRERRIEIVTGITQQAAVAIQNDILQREVLERERLEREMQLAREIQSTFLPEQLPQLKGWDLDIRWRPARQVGGDFYDIFELPNNHLGIVIADVADKGMPAALYMTLVRTLIRAAVHDLYLPKEVLRRVNDLLVPDSRQGMFVTLVYAVLSLDTGELTYANAGHNPPLSRDGSTGEITEHARGSMALGVYREIDIGESKFTLMRGDLFLLYTDGITEAFSSMDELFGTERLKEIISNSSISSASSLLDVIEASVSKFSNGLSQSDDVTLVAIYRQNN